MCVFNGFNFVLLTAHNNGFEMYYKNQLLYRSSTSKLEAGLEAAKLQLKSVVTQVQSFLDMHQIISAGPFLYVLVQEASVMFSLLVTIFLY